jgi:DNA-binding transcriptional LysR family regulator
MAKENGVPDVKRIYQRPAWACEQNSAMLRGELDDLAAFAAIARTRSFTRASVELKLSPSALSHAMKELEARLGVRLLARTTRSVAPTPAGERLLASLEPALREVQAGLRALDDWRNDTAGTIRVTALSVAAATVLTTALPRFLLAHPEISVEIVVDNRLTDLVAEGFDAGIRFGYAVEQDMVAVRIGPDVRTIVVGSPAYFERHGRPQTPTDLNAHNCVNYRQAHSGRLMPWDFERDGKEIHVRPEGQLVLNDGDLAIAAVLAGVGIGYVLEDSIFPHLAAGRLVQVLEEWCAPFAGLHLYYPNRHVAPATRALIDALKWKGAGPEETDRQTAALAAT